MAREKVGSRTVVRDGKNSTYQLVYRVEGQGLTSAAAISQILAESPTSVVVDGVTLSNRTPSVRDISNGYWEGTVNYKHIASKGAEDSNQNLDEAGKIEVTCDFGTETKHITEGEAAGTAYAVTGGWATPSDSNPINVTDNGVEGVDILSPAGNLQRTKVFTNAEVFATDWIQNRADLRCHTNNAAYYGFEAGSLLFTRMSFTVRNSGDVPVTFQFQHRGNLNEPTAISIGNVDKKGHEYLWTRYETEEDVQAGETIITKAPVAQYVHQVYKEANFNTLLSTTP